MPQFLKALIDRVRVAPWSCPFLIALAYAWGLRGAYTYIGGMIEVRRNLRIDIEGDTAYIYQAILDHPTPASLLPLWANPWYKDVPYYRPLSVVFFWIEHKIFGVDGLLGFQAVHWFTHGLFLALLWGFFAQLAGKWRAAVAVAIFAAGWNDVLVLPTGVDAFNCWKDTVDIWAASAMVGTAWLYLNYLRGAGKKYAYLALGLWIINLMIKESGFVVPMMLALVLWYSGKIRERWPSLAVYGALTPLLWLYRSWAVGGYGNRTGGGHSWPVRFALDGLGIPPRIVNGDLLALVPILFFGSQIYAVLRWRHKPRRAAGIALAGAALAAACVATTIYHTEMPFQNTTERFFLAGPWYEACMASVIGAMYGLFLANRERVQIFALLWVWINFAPLIVQPPTSPHVFYPIAPGWSLFLACTLWAMAEKLKSLGLPKFALVPGSLAARPSDPPA